MSAVFMFLGLLALILINVPIGISLGVVAMVAMVIHGGMDSLLSGAITMNQTRVPPLPQSNNDSPSPTSPGRR